MKASTYMPMLRALEILKKGAVQPTETFVPLMDKRKTDQEWSRRARAVAMLNLLGTILIATESPWILVQMAKRGQSGLYQLQKRPMFEIPSFDAPRDQNRPGV